MQTGNGSHAKNDFEADSLPFGEAVRFAAKVLAPNPAEVRQMLLALRKRLGWSQADAAFTLNVSNSCIAKWEGGSRVPNGAAARLIFQWHLQEFDKNGKIKNLRDLVSWGKNSPGDHEKEATEAEGTLLPLEGNLSECQVVPSSPREKENQPVQPLPEDSAPKAVEMGTTPAKPAEPDRLAVLRARADFTQVCLANAMRLVHRSIVTLPENKNRRRHLRELSMELGTLSTKMSESLELSLKLGGGPPDRNARGDLDESWAPPPNFVPGRKITPCAIKPKLAES